MADVALLNDKYISERAKLIREKAIKIDKGDVSPFINSDTCYFCCIDKDSNGCSMINSNYLGFGTGTE
jgi:gamma-glutamyltranspeptidase/glutathione hydrolase